MKKTPLVLCLLSVFSLSFTTVQAKPQKTEDASVNNDASEQGKLNLLAKLAPLNHFSADFEQRVFDEEGNELQVSSGNLAVQKPNLVNWQTLSPDETLIVSDGDTLWYYDEFIEQASAYRVSDSIADTPILLLTSNNDEDWLNYRVKTVNPNEFQIIAKATDSKIKSLTVSFEAESSSLNQLQIEDSTGQISKITLTNNSFEKIDQTLFQFTPPQGVFIDDQR